MASTQTTSFPILRPHSQVYVTPPNSQGNPQQYLQQHPQHYTSQNSPMAASQTPANLSPTSPSQAFNLPVGNRQLRHPKSPMYVPAALRPTERQHRPSPLTPPHSAHGSTDSLNKTDQKRPISRRSTNESKKKSTLGQEPDPSSPSTPIAPTDLPPITGPPSRTHWKTDTLATICDDPVCPKRFSIFERRHHCRHCGNVFCGEHSRLQVPLDQDAEFHPDGTYSRACGYCSNQYEKWVEERKERVESGGSNTPITPVKAVLPRDGSGKVTEGKNSTAQSLNQPWTWSTF